MGAGQPIQQHLPNIGNLGTPVAGVGEAMFYGSQLTMDQDSQAPGIAMDIVAEEAEQSGDPGAAKKKADSDDNSRTRVHHHTLRLGVSAACFGKLGRVDKPFQLTPGALRKMEERQQSGARVQLWYVPQTCACGFTAQVAIPVPVQAICH